MKQLQPDLWQGTRHGSGMLSSHAYFLQRPKDGGVLLYNTGNDEDLQHIEDLGGIGHQLLTHRDEAGPSLVRIKERFGSRLCCSQLEVPSVSKYAPVDLAFGPGDHEVGGIRVIEPPGHTNGSIYFFYESPHGKTYLFTGDTFFPSNGSLSTFVITSFGGSEASLASSLGRIRKPKPDIVMSSGFIGDVALVELAPTQWEQAIDGAIVRLRH